MFKKILEGLMSAWKFFGLRYFIATKDDQTMLIAMEHYKNPYVIFQGHRVNIYDGIIQAGGKEINIAQYVYHKIRLAFVAYEV